MSWANFILDLASIPVYKTPEKEETKKKAIRVSPEDEQAHLMRMLGKK